MAALPLIGHFDQVSHSWPASDIPNNIRRETRGGNNGRRRTFTGTPSLASSVPVTLAGRPTKKPRKRQGGAALAGSIERPNGIRGRAWQQEQPTLRQ